MPRRGLEPPRIAPLVPETSASTNSATWARMGIGTGGSPARRAIYRWCSGVSIKRQVRDEVDEENQESTRRRRRIRAGAQRALAIAARPRPASLDDAARGRAAARLSTSWPRASAATASRRAGACSQQLDELLHAGEIIRNRRDEYCLRERAAARRRHRQRASRRSRLPAAGRSLGADRSCRRARCAKRCTATASRCASAATDDRGRPRRRDRRSARAQHARDRRPPVRRVRHRLRRARQSAHRPPRVRAARVTSAARTPARSCSSKLVEQPSRTAQPLGHVTRVLGEHAAPGMETEIAIHSHGLPFEFPREAVAEAEAFGRAVSAAAKRGREDLRELPLVTIDGEDARDFDDAVYCEEVRGGWRLVVAIADVATLRRPGLRARQGSAASRHVGLLSEPRAADAAGGAVERPVLAESEGRPPVHGVRDAGQRRRAK